MPEQLNNFQLEDSLENALRNQEPVYINQNHQFEKYYTFLKDKSYPIYLEILSNSLCTEYILVKYSGLRLDHIKVLNKILSDQLFKIEYYDSNDSGCNTYHFYTLNVELYNKFKDVYK